MEKELKEACLSRQSDLRLVELMQTAEVACQTRSVYREGLSCTNGGSLRVECLNRKQRRERTKNPGKYARRVPKTRYPSIGSNKGDGKTIELLQPTTGLPTGMAVTWLGTSSGAPTWYRNVSSIALRFPERTFVFDAGEGTQIQLMKTDIFPASIQKIFVTHMHGDHCFGLPGLLSLINETRLYHNRAEMMYVYGPPGLGELMRMSLPHWFDRLRMSITIVEFTTNLNDDDTPQPMLSNNTVFVQKMPPTTQSPVLQDQSCGNNAQLKMLEKGYQWHIDAGDNITITAAQLKHRVPCWGYVVKEADYDPAPWEIELWKKQQEDDVTDDDIARRELAYPGRKVVILGDTCNSDTMLKIGRNADLLSHEATFSSEMKKKALIAQHSTARMAGDFARRLEAKRLVLTHFSPRYGLDADMSREKSRKDINDLISQAKKTFGSDAVTAADDFTTINIPIDRNSTAASSLVEDDAFTSLQPIASNSNQNKAQEKATQL